MDCLTVFDSERQGEKKLQMVGMRGERGTENGGMGTWQGRE